MMIKNMKFVELNTKIATAFLNTYFNDDLIEYKCLCCNKDYERKFDDNLMKRFFN